MRNLIFFLTVFGVFIYSIFASVYEIRPSSGVYIDVLGLSTIHLSQSTLWLIAVTIHSSFYH